MSNTIPKEVSDVICKIFKENPKMAIIVTVGVIGVTQREFIAKTMESAVEMFQSFGQLFISARAVPIGMTEPESEPDSNSIVEMDTNNSTALAQTDAFSTASPDDTDACGSTNPVKKPDCENIENTGSLIINDLTAGSTAENTSNRSTYVSNVAGPSSENTTIVNHNNENSWIDNRINGAQIDEPTQAARNQNMNTFIQQLQNRWKKADKRFDSTESEDDQ